MITSFTPAELVSEVVAAERERAGLSVAELAERACIPAAEVKAVEAGEPAPIETLVAIARGLDRNPYPLILAGGFVGERYLRAALAGLFVVEDEFPDGWGGWPAEKLASARALLRDPATEGEAVRRLALEIFQVPDTEQTRWRERSISAYARGRLLPELTLLIDFWGYFEYTCWEASSKPVTWEGLVKTGAHVCEADLARPASAAA